VNNDPVEILLVEDNPNDAELALHAFKRYKISNNIHVVRDGAEALDFVFCIGGYAARNVNNRPKVILLDLKLPKVDGIEVLRRIRGDERTHNIPVVVLTSSHEDRDIAECYKLGVDFEQFTESVRVLGLYWLLLNRPPR
jgi:two-component system response regulator